MNLKPYLVVSAPRTGVSNISKQKTYRSWFKMKNVCAKYVLLIRDPSPPVYPGRQNIIHVIKCTRPSPFILYTASDQKLDGGRHGNEAILKPFSRYCWTWIRKVALSLLHTFLFDCLPQGFCITTWVLLIIRYSKRKAGCLNKLLAYLWKLYGFCLSIAYIALPCHPYMYIESLPTFWYKINDKAQYSWVCEKNSAPVIGTFFVPIFASNFHFIFLYIPVVCLSQFILQQQRWSRTISIPWMFYFR